VLYKGRGDGLSWTGESDSFACAYEADGRTRGLHPYECEIAIRDICVGIGD